MLGVGTAAIVAITAAEDEQARQDFYVQLPDSVPDSGYLRIAAGNQIPEPSDAGLGDDMRFWLPEVAATTLCLRKQLESGPVPTTFQFSATGLYGSQTAPRIQVTQSGQPFTASTTPYLVDTPRRVTVTEPENGFYISRAECDRPAFRSGRGAEARNKVSVSERTVALESLPLGSTTICTIYNTDRLAFPTYTAVKRFAGPELASDTAVLRIREIRDASSALSAASEPVANTDTRTGERSYTGSLLRYTSGSDTTSAWAAAQPAQVNIYEEMNNPANYTAAYACTNGTAGSATPLPSGAGTELMLEANFGDRITCTFTNALTAPPTQVTVTKSGLTAVTAGTYTMTYRNDSAAPIWMALTDRLSVPGAAALPTGTTVTASGGGRYDAWTGTVTWAPQHVAPGSSGSQTVTAALPGPVRDAALGDSYSSPNQLSDTASVRVYRDNNGERGTELPVTGTPQAAVTTQQLFAEVRKTVRNVSRGGAVGTDVTAAPSDTLEYCLNYINRSAVPMTLTLKDTLISTQTLIPGSFRGGTNQGSSSQVAVDVPSAAAGAAGSVCFQVRVNGGR